MIKAGVIGWPVQHSLSPQLHGWWLSRYNIPGEYKAYPVEPEKLANFIANLGANGFGGINVTVPHKQSVMQFLHQISPLAQRMGAVNTITVQKDGTLHGDNTDGYGFITSLREEAPGWDHTKPAVILGAGGAARAVVCILQDAGVKNIHIINRTMDHTQYLINDLGVTAQAHGWQNASVLLADAGLLVNTTTLGMKGQPALEFSLETLAKNAVVHDLVYNPLETDLLKNARLRGNTAINGLGMLLHQAAPGFARWFDYTPHVMSEQRKAIEAVIS